MECHFSSESGGRFSSPLRPTARVSVFTCDWFQRCPKCTEIPNEYIIYDVSIQRQHWASCSKTERVWSVSCGQMCTRRRKKHVRTVLQRAAQFICVGACSWSGGRPGKKCEMKRAIFMANDSHSGWTRWQKWLTRATRPKFEVINLRFSSGNNRSFGPLQPVVRASIHTTQRAFGMLSPMPSFAHGTESKRMYEKRFPND